MATNQPGSPALDDGGVPEPSGSEADRAEQAQTVDDTTEEELPTPDAERLVATDDE